MIYIEPTALTEKNGGVAVYCAHNIVPTDAATYSDDYCQSVTLYLKTLNLIVSGVYRPPNASNNQVESFRRMMQQINDFSKKYTSADLHIYGDFNVKFINWQCMVMKPGHGQSLPEQACAQILLDFMRDNLLNQHVNKNTRKDKSILDLVISNNVDSIHSISVEKTICLTMIQLLLVY